MCQQRDLGPGGLHTGDDHDDIYTNIVEPGQQDLSRDQMEPEDGLVGCPASLGGRNGIE